MEKTKSKKTKQETALLDFQTNIVSELKPLLLKIEMAKKENEIIDCVELLKDTFQKQIINCNIIEEHIDKKFSNKTENNKPEPPERIPGW